MRPVPQPSVRPLDDGRLLQLRRVLRADRPQAERGPAGTGRLQQRRRRNEAPGGGRRDAAEVSGREAPDVKRARTAATVLAEWLASPENPFFAKNLANIVWAHFFGSGIVNRSTTCASATRPEPRAARRLGKKFTEYNYDFKRLVRDICTSTHVPADDAAEREQQAATSGTFRTRDPAHRAGGAARRITQVTETKNKFQGLPRGAGGADRRRERQHLFPDDLRPGRARHRLLLRSQDGAEPRPGAAPAERRHHHTAGSCGARWSRSNSKPDGRRNRSSTTFTSVLQPEARRAGARRVAQDVREAGDKPNRSWKTFSGRC